MLTLRWLPVQLSPGCRQQRGTSLIEVLVTLLILAFGLLGVAGLQSKISLAEMESYQRSQALLLLTAMTERLSANRTQAASYVTAGAVGTGDSQPADCTGMAPGPNRDLCEWSNALKGAAEQKSAANIGGVAGARGCIAQLQSPDPSRGVCTPATYQVSVAWQGLNPTVAPALACGQGLYSATDSYRRLVAAQVSLGTTSCY
jgi:type IV pilus assembly protein PilV